jgi:glycosyltransferase involved in cell wall biosynthesis
LPAEHREAVWAVGRAGQDLDVFEGRTATSRWLGFRPLDLGLIVSPIVLGRAMRRTGSGIFHATDPHRPWRNRKFPQVVTAYDLIPLRETEMLASWQPHQRYAYRAYLDQVRRADVVVAISQATADDVSERLGVSPNRIAIVAPVVVPPERPSPQPARDPAGEATFLFVGALDPHKQPDLAVKALARFRADHGAGRLRFIGPSSDSQKAALRDLAATLGIPGFIEFDGRISDGDLDSAYASATALLSTSRIEGFGLPPVEAVLRGVPVISVDIPSARETVGETATLVPSSADAIAAAMAAPTSPTPEAIARIRDRYSRSSAAGALWAAYSRLLG